MHELIYSLIVLIGCGIGFAEGGWFLHQIKCDYVYHGGHREGYVEYDDEKYLKSVTFVEYSEKINAKDREYHYHKGYIDGFNLRKSE